MLGSFIDGLSPVRGWRIGLLVALILCLAPPGALAGGASKLVSYDGYRIVVPRSWPVYDLARDPSICVRFNRHAVYLGRPGANQRCPAHAVGRTEAILVQSVGAQAASAGAAGSMAAPSGSLVMRAQGVLITATWNHDPGLISRVLGVRSLKVASAAARAAAAPAGPSARIASASIIPGGIYTGLGFDVCSTPSTSQMAAWGSSSYHAVGVYIGGVNMACAQPNLSAAWVSGESSAGWHLIPIYVGLQAPSNSCGCAGISPGNASSEGTAAAIDAINDAQSLGLGPGNPLYFDMEAYSRGGTNSAAVLAFLQSWTSELHAAGYKSGVYSSDYSGISDLVSEWAAGYLEPDEIWIANWNGVKTTSDSNVPAADWANHQRLHQYEGGHNETHGGVTLNVDGNYLDASTAASGSVAGTASEPSASSPPTIYGTPLEGQTLTEGHGSWPPTPISYTYQWEDCNTAGISCSPIPGATGQTYTTGAGDVGHTIRVTEVASYTGGEAIPSTSSQTGQVMSTVPLFWLYTAYGNVFMGPGTVWYRSPYANGFRGSSITGMAATRDGGGYWVVGRAGRVWGFGDASSHPATRHPHPIIGIVAAPGGYWLYTASGNVYGSPGTPWYGSPAARGFRGSSVTGMAATSDGKGYWLVDKAGAVFAFGDATNYPPPGHAHPIRGIVAAPGGYWLYTAYGNVYGTTGTPWYRSPSANGFRAASITGMAGTPDGKGYWLVDKAGTVFAYGDAVAYASTPHGHWIIGIAGG